MLAEAFLAIACRSDKIILDNGEIYYHSENGDLDELDEDKFDCDHFIKRSLTRMISTWARGLSSSL
jgi:hypothetical protein